MYKKENELLKKELYKNDDYTNKVGLEDYSNENKKKLIILNDEIKILNSQLEEHRKCLYERNLLNKEYLELKKNLKELKQTIKEAKDSLKERQRELELNIIGNIETIEDATSNNNLSPRSNITKTIASHNQKKISRNIIPHLNFRNSYKSTLLPAILSPTSNKSDKNILSDEFYSKLRKHYEGRENEYEILLDKIKETENSRNFIENKHKNEIKQFNIQILNLDEQFKVLNNEGKGTGSNIRVLKYKLNTTKNEAKHFLAQLQRLKLKLDFAANVSKDRNHEIFLLKEQITSIRNKTINRMKKELEKESVDSEESEKNKKLKVNESKKNIKDKKKDDIKNKNKSSKNVKNIKNDSVKNSTIKNDIINNSNNNENKLESQKKIINIKKSINSSKNKNFNLNLKEKKK